MAKISALKFLVRHIRGAQNIVADTLSRMFESSTSETPNQVECHLTLTNFPLALHELGQLQKNPVLTVVVAQLEKGENVGNYFLSKGILYCRSRSGKEPNLVFPTSAISMVFTYFHESLLEGHMGVFKTINKIVHNLFGMQWTGIFVRGCARVRYALSVNPHRNLGGVCWPRKLLRDLCRRSSLIM